MNHLILSAAVTKSRMNAMFPYGGIIRLTTEAYPAAGLKNKFL